MSAHIPRGNGGSVIIGQVYSDLGGGKGNEYAKVEVARDGGIVLRSGVTSEAKTLLSVNRVNQVIELLQKAVEVSGKIDKLFTDLQLEEHLRLQEIVASITEVDDDVRR